MYCPGQTIGCCHGDYSPVHPMAAILECFRNVIGMYTCSPTLSFSFLCEAFILPFGDQFWALSSICQCIAIHSIFPGKMSLYTVATYSQHSVASNIFASRAVFAVLRPISVALSRHQFWAVCDPIIGPVAGALQSQRDALAHRAWLMREQSSIENDVGIQVTHLLVLSHLTDEKLNKTTVNSGNLLFWHRIWTISTWVFTRSKYKQILCK